jgi:Domain of unknown function (DUF6532)
VVADFGRRARRRREEAQVDRLCKHLVIKKSPHVDGQFLQIQSWAGASQMRGELKKKAIAILCAHYGIPGNSKAETMDLVEWLLEKGHFKYGGLNTKVGGPLVSF